jgi:uncharacterized metal-binding protein YceD (DUF177 family)
MNPLNEYNIPFVGLGIGKHHFKYELDNKFFSLFNYSDFVDINCSVNLDFNKKSTLFELIFNVTGTATLICDVSNEPFEQQLENTMELIVKFGDNFNNDNDEILILPHEAFQINIAQYLYEAVVLSVPIKKVHPGIADGSLKSETLNKLKEYEIHEKKEKDPRWEALNQLLTQKNK